MNEFFADTVKVHSNWSDNEYIDLTALTEKEVERAKALSYEKLEIIDIFFFDDKVVACCKCYGTHEGTYEGLSASAAKFVFSGMLMYRIQENKICEIWSSFDKLNLLRQLGEVSIAPKISNGQVKDH